MTYGEYLKGLGTGQTSDYFDATDFNKNAVSNIYKRADGSYSSDATYDTSTGGMNLKSGLQGVQALSGLANAYVGYKGLGLAQDQFGFQKAAANRNLSNQAKLLNENRLNSTNVGLALAGSTMTGAQRDAARKKTIAGNVDGSRIG